MNECNDHWCEYYGKNSEKCEKCEKRHIEQDQPVLNVILKRRAYELMDVDKPAKKKRDGPDR